MFSMKFERKCKYFSSIKLVSLRKLVPLRSVSTNRSLKRGPLLAYHKTRKSNPQENTGLYHYVVAVCKPSVVRTKMLILVKDRS